MMAMDYTLFFYCCILVLVQCNNSVNSSSSLNNKRQKLLGPRAKSELFIDEVKNLLNSKPTSSDDQQQIPISMHEIFIELQRKEAHQLKWINKVRKAMEVKPKHKIPYKLDPDAKKNLTELIKSQGYPVEKYFAKTQDGFLLDLHRIPHGKNKSAPASKEPRPVIFLQHGLLSSACDWVINFDNDSLGFILADNGYDVWMGNSRGNTYSKKHIHLKPDNASFWDWSFHELAVYDTPAFLDLILNVTKQPSLYFAGHAQGTMLAFILLSEKPEYQQKIRLFVGLAPIISIQHMKSPIKYFSVFPDSLIYEDLGHQDYLPHNEFIEALVEIYCDDNVTDFLCNDILFILNGPDISNLNTSRVEVYTDHTPAGSSVKNLVHFTQMYRQKRFAMYDFGSPSENMKHYKQTTPPAYNVSRVTVPSLLFAGTNDWMADLKDFAILNSTLPNIKGSYVIDGWNHLDFVWGMDAAVLCYHKILEYLPRF